MLLKPASTGWGRLKPICDRLGFLTSLAGKPDCRWLVGGPRRGARPSPISAISTARTGEDGSARETVALSRRRKSGLSSFRANQIDVLRGFVSAYSQNDAFAGLWTAWHGVRGPKSAPVEGRHELFGFLTTEANAVVAPIYPKAMPVILTEPAEFDRWREAEMTDALKAATPSVRRGPADRSEGREKGRPRHRCGLALKPSAESRAADLRRPLHHDEAGTLKMLNEALRPRTTARALVTD